MTIKHKKCVWTSEHKWQSKIWIIILYLIARSLTLSKISSGDEVSWFWKLQSCRDWRLIKLFPGQTRVVKLLKLWNFLFNIKCTLTAVKIILIFFGSMTLSCCYGCGKPIIDRFSIQEFEYITLFCMFRFLLTVLDHTWHVECVR